MTLEDIILRNKPVTKDKYCLIPLIFDTKRNRTKRRKREEWSPGAQGKAAGELFNGNRVSLLQDERVLEIYFAAIRIYLTHSKMFKIRLDHMLHP
jgi:DUF1365 family protein